MVDKVKPLKLEDTGSGSMLDSFPKETDPTEDYVAGKGFAIENDDNLLIDAAGGAEIQFTDTVSGTKKVSDLLDADQEDFDPTGTELTSTKTGPAAREISNKLFTKNQYLYDDVTSFSTTSISYVDILTDTSIYDAGTYRMGWTFSTTNSKSNTNNTTNVLVAGNIVFSKTQNGLLSNSINGFKGDIIHAGGSLTINIETKRDSGNGTVLLSDIRYELRRIL